MKTTRIKMVIGCALIFSGCRVSTPGAIEREMAKGVKHKITVGGKNTRNPIAATPENIKSGQQHFGHHCGICHGLDGEATGEPLPEKKSAPIPSFMSAARQ